MIESQIAYVMDALREMRERGADIVEVRPEVEAALQRRGPAADAGHGLEHRLHELVPGRAGQQPDAVAGLDVALPAPHGALQPEPSTWSHDARSSSPAPPAGIGSATAELLRARRARASSASTCAAPTSTATCATRRRSTRAVAEAIERLGGLDVLINNAGLGIAAERGAAARRGRAEGPRRQPDRPVARDRPPRCPRCASRAGAWSTSPAASPTSPSRSRPRTRCPSAASSPTRDSLRLEEGDRITVTTVYPGYIRTAIHARSHGGRRAARGRRARRAARGRRPHARPRRARRRRRATSRRPARARVAYALAAARPARAPRSRHHRAHATRSPARATSRADGLAGEYAARLRS